MTAHKAAVFYARPGIDSQEKNMKRNNRAFTLIEMLVSVLIIAILAAVALPQYQKAVYKSQGAEALQAMAIMDKVQHDYYLEHGTYYGIQNEGAIAIELPALKYFQCEKFWQPNGHNYQTDYLNKLVPSAASDGSLNLRLKNQDISISNNWDYGKKREAPSCSPIEKCNKYFNCNIVTISGISSGTPYSFQRCSLE